LVPRGRGPVASSSASVSPSTVVVLSAWVIGFHRFVRLLHAQKVDVCSVVNRRHALVAVSDGFSAQGARALDFAARIPCRTICTSFVICVRSFGARRVDVPSQEIGLKSLFFGILAKPAYDAWVFGCPSSLSLASLSLASLASRSISSISRSLVRALSLASLASLSSLLREPAMDLSTSPLTAFSSRGICVFVFLVFWCMFIIFFTGRSFFSAPISPSRKKAAEPYSGKVGALAQALSGCRGEQSVACATRKTQRGGMRAQKVTLDCGSVPPD
jgi:hypothetical protein